MRDFVGEMSNIQPSISNNRFVRCSVQQSSQHFKKNVSREFVVCVGRIIEHEDSRRCVPAQKPQGKIHFEKSRTISIQVHIRVLGLGSKKQSLDVLEGRVCRNSRYVTRSSGRLGRLENYFGEVLF